MTSLQRTLLTSFPKLTANCSWMKYFSPCPFCSLRTGKEWCGTRWMAFPILFNWQHRKAGSTQHNCKENLHLRMKWTSVPVFLSLRMDQSIVDMYILSRDRLGLCSQRREVILTGQFSALFFQVQNILALILPTQILFIWALLCWGWVAIIQFMSNLLKDSKVILFGLTAEFIARFT